MAEKIIIRRYEAPCGPLLLGAFEGRLCLCDWLEGKNHGRVVRALLRRLATEMAEGTATATERAMSQLDEYFAGRRKEFDVPCLHAGTDFQQTVWRTIDTIPCGETMTYSDLAAKIGRPLSVRAVANATGANPISVITPCHRVIGSDGSLTGYGGGLAVKQYLLKLENGIEIR